MDFPLGLTLGVSYCSGYLYLSFLYTGLIILDYESGQVVRRVSTAATRNAYALTVSDTLCYAMYINDALDDVVLDVF